MVCGGFPQFQRVKRFALAFQRYVAQDKIFIRLALINSQNSTFYVEQERFKVQGSLPRFSDGENVSRSGQNLRSIKIIRLDLINSQKNIFLSLKLH